MQTIFNTHTNEPQHLIILGEAELRTILAECISEALKEVKNEKPQPYTRADVMEVLHIKSTALWLLQQNGTLHPFKVGGKVLYDRTEVDAVASGKRGGNVSGKRNAESSI